MAKAGLIYGPGEDIMAPITGGLAVEKLAIVTQGSWLMGNLLQTNPSRWDNGGLYDGSLSIEKLPVLNKGDDPVTPPNVKTIAISQQSKVKNEAW